MLQGKRLQSKTGWTNLALALLFLLAIGFSARGTQFSPGDFFQPGNAKAIGRFAGGLWPPATDLHFLKTILGLILETLEIALLGTAIAVFFGIPLSLLATRQQGEEFSRLSQGTGPWVFRWCTYYLARTLLNVLRGIPELVWALIFVVAVGLGSFPGVLALAAHSTGILGKLYAEVFESTDHRLVETVRVTGASEIKVFFYARLPLSLPVFISYTLFRWECNLRTATLLGFVGAGGLGTQLIISMKLFRYDEVMTLVLAIILLVALVELLGQLVRTRILDGPR
ncbi:MAG: phosphonate ABC transporter, permease protein PhnE [Bacillota bacterium]